MTISESQSSAPTPQNTAPQPEAPVQGTSFLGEMAAATVQQNLEDAPQPQPAAQPGSADEAIREVKQDAESGRPEHIPEKFWDAENKMVKVDELGKSYVNLEKLLGNDSRVTIPKEDDDQEGWEKVYKALGRPEDAAEYEFEDPALPEGMEYDTGLEETWRDLAFANGLSAKQAQNIYNGYVKLQAERAGQWQEHLQQSRAELMSGLQRKYGANYEGKLSQGRAFFQKFATPDMVQWMDETGAGNDPRFIDFIIRSGAEIGGETKLQGKPEQHDTPENIQKAIANYRAKHHKELYDSTHPNHQSVVQELYRLTQAQVEG